MIDLHCHILPGIDDGPASIEESVALVRAAAQDGTRKMVATSHVSWRYANEPDTIRRLVAELNARLAAERLAVEVLPGAEVSATRIADIDPQQLARMRLGEGPWLLVEPPFTRTAYGLDVIFMELQRQGNRIVIAHPERCPAFQREPDTLKALVGLGALTSITAGSLTGRFGGEVRRFATRLLADGLVHNVSSDAHDLRRRPPALASELQRAGVDESIARWLAESVPHAILTGAELPAPPPDSFQAPRPARRRLRWSRH
jgi:protein-tyrosine phosphatase